MTVWEVASGAMFFQMSLYIAIRLAHKGVTLGELTIIVFGATALFMELGQLTIARMLTRPYIKTYRLPTPLLLYQIALVPGSLLTGFLLSPLLALSRHIAQQPMRRLRRPSEREAQRRWLAFGFYVGSVLVVGGLLGTWTRWCLGRDPWVWAVRWLVEGPRAWTRPALLAYWAGLGSLSVAGWNRQLARSRRTLRPRLTSGAAAAAAGEVAAETLPTLGVNGRRKFFHVLAVVMFVPGIGADVAFTHVAFGAAFALFVFAEYVRYFAVWPFGAAVHVFLSEFLDAKDSGTAVLSHFYLLTGCASSVWFEAWVPPAFGM
jgi:dolichol kinase